MGSDIYHLILQALVYNLHFSRLHSVSATTAKEKKERSPCLLYFQQAEAFSWQKSSTLSGQQTCRNCNLGQGRERNQFYDFGSNDSPNRERKSVIHLRSVI